MQKLIAAFISASSSSEILAAGKAIYDSSCEYIAVSEEQELEYYRAVSRFAKAGGSSDITDILMTGVEV